MDLQSLSYVNADLAAATNPQLVWSGDPRESPPLGSGGAPTGTALVAIVKIALAEDPLHRTCRITIDSYDDAETYTYTQDGVDAALLATGQTEAEFLEDWAADITATLSTVAVAEALDTDGDGVVDQIRVRQIDASAPDDPFGVSIEGAATGTAAITITADPAGAAFALLVRVRDNSENDNSRTAALQAAWNPWASPSGLAIGIAVEPPGASVILPCSAFEAIYPYVSSASVTAVSGDQAVGTAGGCTFEYGVEAFVWTCVQTGQVGG